MRVLPRTGIAGQLVIVVGIDAGELITEGHGVLAPRRRGCQTLQQQAKLKRSRTADCGVGQGALVTLRGSAHGWQTYTAHKPRSIMERPTRTHCLGHTSREREQADKAQGCQRCHGWLWDHHDVIQILEGRVTVSWTI